MKLNQIKYFIAVAEAGSTTRAAEMLNLTQPAITRGIHHLEEEIGVRLFERLPRSIRLTRLGEAYLRHARAVFVQLDNARAEMSYLAENPVEEIVIGAGPTWLRATLPEVVSDLSRAFPEVSIRVRGGYDKQLLTMLDRGEVAFVLTETSRNRARSDLDQEPLIHCEYVVAGCSGAKEPPTGRQLESQTVSASQLPMGNAGSGGQRFGPASWPVPGHQSPRPGTCNQIDIVEFHSQVTGKLRCPVFRRAFVT